MTRLTHTRWLPSSSRGNERTGSLHEAVKELMEVTDGAYSITGIMDDGTLFAFKDPYGIKPLCYGFSDGIYAFSSESTGLAINGIEWQRELRPGELLIVKDGTMSQVQAFPSRRQAFCAFEYAYFSRPDSRYNGMYVYQARRELGAALARMYKEVVDRCEIVVCLPESAIDAAYGFHEESGLRWEMALRRHRYVSQRAFITDGVDRQSVIYRKLNILAPQIVGKRIAVVDDSIVRGEGGTPVHHVSLDHRPMLLRDRHEHLQRADRGEDDSRGDGYRALCR